MLNTKETFEKIKQSRPIQECLNMIQPIHFHETIWFIYYMFFAIHNPKMEEYIQKKLNTVATIATTATAITNDNHQRQQAWRDIIKNMIKRRHHTSEIVFRLYTHAYTNQGSVTHIYPNYKYDISKQMIKSYQTNNLRTTAVLLRRITSKTTFDHHDTSSSTLISFLDYVITTAQTAPSASTSLAVLNKINNHISYAQKDIIILALMCYMKLHEDDINKKNIFIAATEEDDEPYQIPATATAANEPERSFSYDEKYKYLYT
jgi:hypothetical protein